MNIVYQWVFSNFVSITDKDFPGNIITSVNYQLIARSGAASASTSGVLHLEAPELADFVNFHDVTQPHLEAWAAAGLGKDGVQTVKDGLAEQIVKQVNSKSNHLPKSFQPR